MRRMVLGIFLATVALFAWGALFWMNPLPMKLVKSTPDDIAAREALIRHFPESGVYLFPGQHNEKAVLENLMKSGPVATVNINHDGVGTMEPLSLVMGIVHELIFVALLAFLLRKAGPALSGYAGRVGFVVLAGSAAVLLTELTDPIWWHHPWPWHMLSGLYFFIGWIITGLVLARFIRPEASRV